MYGGDYARVSSCSTAQTNAAPNIIPPTTAPQPATPTLLPLDVDTAVLPTLPPAVDADPAVVENVTSGPEAEVQVGRVEVARSCEMMGMSVPESLFLPGSRD